MEAKNLMVGDYVRQKHSGLLLKVRSIKPPYIEAEDEEGQFNEDTLVPIPLTSEILEKTGFKTDDNNHFAIQGQSNTLELVLNEMPFDAYTFDIVRTERTTNKCGQRCYIDRFFASCDYVHELQNALRLCQIEKEIVL